MDIFTQDKLNPQAFDSALRLGTHDLNDVLAAAAQTESPAVETTHFLIAMGRITGGATQKGLARLGLPLDAWESGLSESAVKSPGRLPPAHLTRQALDAGALDMLSAARAFCEHHTLFRLTETVLLLFALKHLTPPVRDLCDSAGLDIEAWIETLEKSLMPVEPIAVFNTDADGTLRMEAFSASGKKVLEKMKTEAEALGYASADPRHLALGMINKENGVAEYALFRQGLSPRKISEAFMLNLRNKSRRRRGVVVMARTHFPAVLVRMLNLSGELAGRDHADKIYESHLLLAFLETESMALRLLEDEKADLAAMKSTAEQHPFSEETEEADFTLADIDTVRRRLMNRLVGQDQAIERILPFIQRMRFGFAMPERPVGVFLFCGQSGSGKTEMAKELARAVYGTEENLIFLEMGQFNSPESMNIFVGAPPGYVGYGEGKLTNGLRDKPRSVVLFDEVEKAHPRVLDALLRFLDEGRIDDPAGPVRDGSQCIVILTSNVGAVELSRMAKEIEDHPESQAMIRKKLREQFARHDFRVEFLNRVDELILFRTLDVRDYGVIAERLLMKNLERMERDHQITVAPDPGVAVLIGRYCDEVGEGARATARMVQSVVITPVIDYVLQNRLTPPLRLNVRALEGGGTGMPPSGVVTLNP